MTEKIPDIILKLAGRRLASFKDTDEQTRFLQYCIVTSIAGVVLVGFAVFSYLRHAPVLATVLLVVFACTVVGCVLVFLGVRARFVYRWNILLFTSLLIYLLFLGGEDNSMVIWITITPLLMFYLLGRKEGLAGTTLIGFIVLIFFWGPFPFAERTGYPVLFVLRLMMAYVIISYLTYFYEKFRYLSQLEMEQKHRTLQAEIQEREKAQESMRRSDQRYRAIYLQAAEGILLIDFEGNIVESNPQMAQMLEYQEDELIGKNIFDFFHPENLKKIPPQIDKLRAGETIFIERQLRTASGIYLLCEQSGKRIDDNHIILLYRDIRERKIAELALEKANAALERLAHIDGLTQIANRRCFDIQLHQEWQRLAREKKHLAIIFCDIDYFKQFNDVYGHLEGDDCLKKVARVLASEVHRPADLVSRYGGEEFVVLLPDTDFSGASRIAEKMRRSIAGLKIPHKGSEVDAVVTMSFGIAAIIPGSDIAVDDLINMADQALYVAKEKGRNRIASQPQATMVERLDRDSESTGETPGDGG